jgi:hypothetical protein
MMSLFVAGLVAQAGLAAPQEGSFPSVDLSKLRPADFDDDELDLPFHLFHFHRLAGSVLMDGPDRGFITLPIWRPANGNKPYNARIMESILSLAFFYATDRPWNSYSGSPALRARLEAALDFWCRVQAPDGKFSEYAPQGWNLAATAFATKFMGQTLTLLSKGPAIDKDLHRRVFEADRKALRIVFTDDVLREHGRSYSNQYSNAFAGALAFLKLNPDPEIEKLLRLRVEEASRDHQSPAGFFYEANGSDWGYNLSTHQSNLQMAWHHSRGTPLGKEFAEHERRWFEWLSWNATPEPDWSGFFLNRSIESRQRMGWLAEKETPLAEAVTLARAFSPTEAEFRGRQAESRKALVSRWPEVEPLRVGEFWAYSPYVFLHRDHVSWRPAEAQRDEARRGLPFLARDRFTRQLTDSRNPLVFTFARRPSYYAAFNSGKHLTPQQRYGLGLLWSARMGAVMQSQTAGQETAWGAMARGAKLVYEAGDVEASFRAGEQPVTPQPGSVELPSGDLVVRYRLGAAGEKTIAFADSGITVTVWHKGPFLENLPLLVVPADKLEILADRVTLTGPSGVFTISFGKPGAASVLPQAEAVGPKQVKVVRLQAEHELTYSLEIR